MPNKITVRKGEKPLLVMDGTGDVDHLWLCSPNQKAFFRYPILNQYPAVTVYMHKKEGWMFLPIEPELNLQPVVDPGTVELLDGMEKAVFLWAKEGGYAAC
jgi:hypothetical protein